MLANTRSFRKIALTLLATLMALPTSALADYHFQKKSDDVSSEEQQLAAEITAFLAEYEVAYNNQDYRTVKSMWVDDGNPVYMAEEVPFPLYGKDRMDNYFNPVPGRRILDGIDNKYSNVRAKLVAPGIAVATYRLDYDIKLIGMPAAHGWDRAMAVFVRDDNSWKLSAYTEAPMGPATMVRKMMKAVPAESEDTKAAYATTIATIKSLTQASVSPGFADFVEARKDLAPTH
jgi:ketosteroid isomerase-like protein